GSATVICTDKTGTLTRNEMTLRVLVTAGGEIRFSGTGYAPEGGLAAGDRRLAEGALRREAEWALTAGQLCNNAAVVEHCGRWTVLGDPSEGALKVAVTKAGLEAARIEARFARIGEVPFSSERKLMSTAHADSEQADRTLLMTKGAPDLLLARCTHEQRGDAARALTAARRTEIRASIVRLAGQALRTIGLAYRVLPAAAQPHANAEQELVWLGVAGMMDPPRPEAVAAVRAAHAG